MGYATCSIHVPGILEERTNSYVGRSAVLEVREVEFGLLLSVRNPDRWFKPYPELYADVVEESQVAEVLGFDAVWLSEHHFVEDGHLSGTLPMLAALAVRTTRVRLGSDLLVLPMHHPLRVAEDGATVDILSNGRFMLGVGVGYRRAEYRTFQIPLAQRGSRMDEALQIIRWAWTGECFAFHGKHWQFRDVVVTPPPVQRPGPPILIGGTSDRAIRRAARLGDGLLADDTLAHQYPVYRRALLELGRDPASATIALDLPVYLDEDAERAWRDGQDHLFYQERLYREWRKEAADFPGAADLSMLQSANDIPRHLFSIGDPAGCIRAIEFWLGQGPFTHFCYWQLPGLSRTQALRSLELFATKVIPHFRNR
jgi:probable F420-dependent oxidoreductase